MQIDQPKFLWMTNAVPNIKGIDQIGNGVVTASLTDNIKITHDYKSRNKVTVEFKSGKFLVPDVNELREFYNVFSKDNDEVALFKHCEKHLIPA